MKKILLLLLAVYSTGLFAQKKELYMTEHRQKLTKAEYLEMRKDSRYLGLNLENDDHYLNLIVERERRGKLSEEGFVHLKDYLAESSGGTFNESGFTVIYYITGQPIMEPGFASKWIALNKSNIKKMKRRYPGLMHYLFYHKNQVNINRDSQSNITWFPDEEELLKKLFYKYDIYYNNFTVIDSQGNYITFLGESGAKQVFERLEELAGK